MNLRYYELKSIRQYCVFMYDLCAKSRGWTGSAWGTTTPPNLHYQSQTLVIRLMAILCNKNGRLKANIKSRYLCQNVVSFKNVAETTKKLQPKMYLYQNEGFWNHVDWGCGYVSKDLPCITNVTRLSLLHVVFYFFWDNTMIFCYIIWAISLFFTESVLLHDFYLRYIFAYCNMYHCKRYMTYLWLINAVSNFTKFACIWTLTNFPYVRLHVILIINGMIVWGLNSGEGGGLWYGRGEGGRLQS